MEEDEDEDWQKEMENMRKIEELKAILNRLRTIKKQGQQEGIDEKIAEVEEELGKYIVKQDSLKEEEEKIIIINNNSRSMTANG